MNHLIKDIKLDFGHFKFYSHLAPVHEKITQLSQREKVLENVLKDFTKEQPGLMERLRFAGLVNQRGNRGHP